MTRFSLLVVAGTGMVLCACAGVKGVDPQARNPFGVTIGAEDGNTFSAKPAASEKYKTGSPAPEPAGTAAALVPGRPNSPIVPVPLVAGDTTAQAAPVRIDIDANAYGAVFGTTSPPVKPTPAQLMQLDSLSLMAADPLRVDLQTRILQCRRNGDACRIGSR